MKTDKSVSVIVLLFIVLHVPPACAGKYALVIGNGSYTDAPLPTPVNDADVMAATLKSLGFSVEKETDVSKPDMKKAIREFGNRLNPGDTALFYFSGHGAQAEGSNYLIPIGADIQSEDEILDQSVPAEMVLEKMKTARSAVNIIILDACRNNPFKGFKSLKEGLAPMSAVKGSFIAYATAPGTVAWTGTGSTSIYTDYLVKTMKTPGMKIEDVFKRVREAVISETGDRQIPWEASSLTGGDFYFAGGNPVPPDSVPVRIEPKIKPTSGPMENARDGRFVAYDNGTVQDTQTGLLWMAKDNGQDIDWYDAKQYCENYTGGGYSDWRMPTQDELYSLVGEENGVTKGFVCCSDCSNYIITKLIHLTCWWVWVMEKDGSSGAFVHFAYGHRDWFHVDTPNYGRALPVRSGK